MAEIHMNVDRLVGIAADIRNVKDSLSDNVNVIQKKVSEIDKSTSLKSINTYRKSFDKYKQSVNNLIESIGEYSKFLENSAGIVKKVDEKIKMMAANNSNEEWK